MVQDALDSVRNDGAHSVSITGSTVQPQMSYIDYVGLGFFA